MHNWGDNDVDWDGIDDAAYFIGSNLIKWFRVSVLQYKEKYGTVRVYCGFGWHCSIHSIVYPGHAYIRWKSGSLLEKLQHNNCLRWIIYCIGCGVTPIQKLGYKFLYWRAVKKWPHLRQEIICDADYGELLEFLQTPLRFVDD